MGEDGQGGAGDLGGKRPESKTSTRHKISIQSKTINKRQIGLSMKGY